MDSRDAPQTIPNPNQDRLGFPPPQSPEPSNKQQRETKALRAHVEALQYAEELLAQGRQLRDDLRNANRSAIPSTVKRQAEQVEKLARKLHSRLKSS